MFRVNDIKNVGQNYFVTTVIILINGGCEEKGEWRLRQNIGSEISFR